MISIHFVQVIAMKIRSVRKYFLTGCLLASSFMTTTVFADWSVPQSQSYKRQGFGDFPPKDIDKMLMNENEKANSMQAESPSSQEQAKDSQSTSSQPAAGQQPASNAAGATGYQPGAVQNPALLNPVPYYGNYPPNYGGYDGYGRGPYYSPWNNRGSGFSTPWGNNNSGFSGPWNNRGSGFSTPWGNNNSGFSGPWNNNGSSFTGPWNNNGSSFGPFGN